MRTASFLLLLIATLAAWPAAKADEPQSLSALVGGKSFASDDDSINLVPVKGSFTLVASTAGASAYPPPKTPIDRLMIRCTAYTEGKATVFDDKAFRDSSLCEVSYSVGTKPMGGDPDEVYTLDKSSSSNRFEITAANGKVIEGRFQFQLKDASGKSLQISDGKYRVEDRQY